MWLLGDSGGAVLYLAGSWLLGHSGYICTEAGSARAEHGLPSSTAAEFGQLDLTERLVWEVCGGADGGRWGLWPLRAERGGMDLKREPGGPGQQPGARPGFGTMALPACAPKATKKLQNRSLLRGGDSGCQDLGGCASWTKWDRPWAPRFVGPRVLGLGLLLFWGLGPWGDGYASSCVLTATCPLGVGGPGVSLRLPCHWPLGARRPVPWVWSGAGLMVYEQAVQLQWTLQGSGAWERGWGPETCPF